MSQPRDFGFDEETGMLKDAAMRFFEEKSPLSALREQTAGTEDPYHGNERSPWFDKQVWSEMIELGWNLLAIPEAQGGIGMGLVAAAAIQEEIGRSACPCPLTNTLQATFLLREANANTQLEKIANGESMGLAMLGEEGSLEIDSTDITANGSSLTGTSWYVQDVSKVDSFIVTAKSDKGLGLYWIASGSAEIKIDKIVDLTRDQGRLVLDNAAAELIAEGSDAEQAIKRAMPAIYTLLAADMAGAAEWQLQTTAEYAKVRTQFDRPIGFFQAVKHPIVNMMIAADETRSLVYAAAAAYDFDPETAQRAAHFAKSSASDTASFCSNRSTQLHGGIGFTWESDVQIYHKRQMHSQFLLGDGNWHREQVAELL